MDTAEDVRIIKLAPGTEVSGVISFEEAFGEHSPFKGRGRARRKRKKAARRLKRRTRRENRKHRKEVDEAEADLYNSQTGREGLGDAKAEAQQRFNESNPPEETEAAGPSGGAATPDQGATDNGGGAPVEEAPSADQGSQDQGSGDEAGEEESTGDDEGNDDEGSDDSGFDGTGTKTEYEYETEDFSGFEGDEMASYFVAPGGKRLQVNKNVQALITQIEYEKAKFRKAHNRLENARIAAAKTKLAADIAKYHALADAQQGAKQAIAARVARLNKILEAYKRPQGAQARYTGLRREEVNAAQNHLYDYLMKKRDMRNSFGGTEQMSNSGEMGFSNQTTPLVKSTVTIVNPGLDPKFGTQRIEIPATSSAEGEDNPRTRIVELSSSAEGHAGKINWKLVAIGVGVAVAGIWAYNKYGKKIKTA